MPPLDPHLMPAAKPPPGFTSNLGGDKMTKDTDSSIAIAIVGMLISTGFLVIRIYTKAVLAKLFGVDDVLLIIAWMLSMVVQISIVYYMAHAIIGAHIWDLSVAEFQRLARITAVDSVVYLVVMALCKFSILLFYLRLSREKWFTYSIYATMAEDRPWSDLCDRIMYYGHKYSPPLLDASASQSNGHELATGLPIMRLFLKHVAPRLIGETSVHQSGSRRSRQKQDTIGSSELSNLEKSKRSYARMTDTAIIGHSPTGSETGIIGPSGKNESTVVTVERREYAHDSLTPQEPPAAPTPYSHLSMGAEIFPTPPLDRRDSAMKTV
ncbi:hypothetical protein PRZ48_009162 [Zasmidium cellare]|uniref:Rhodopsin domain-containing protein n=1 Tax=Zasmidium cellare TaxID=395010 RepID=A0ABR0EAZ3_ZASCE|nr:hypothetical protein PRZ48_009162 [Zasmidium cellare]